MRPSLTTRSAAARRASQFISSSCRARDRREPIPPPAGHERHEITKDTKVRKTRKYEKYFFFFVCFVDFVDFVVSRV
jgi:hypothetical protein